MHVRFRFKTKILVTLILFVTLMTGQTVINSISNKHQQNLFNYSQMNIRLLQASVEINSIRGLISSNFRTLTQKSKSLD